MGHHHDHDHSHGVESLEKINQIFYIGIGLNLAFTILEFVYGYLQNSVALLADASHNLSDVASLIIAVIGMKLMKKAAQSMYTYGYKKASLLASLINAVLLFAVVINILIESFQRFWNPSEVHGKVIYIVAAVGVVINTVSAFLFYKGQKDDINVKGAFLHLLVDALVSVTVVISGLIIHYTSWNWVDPAIGIVICLVIVTTSWGLLKESIRLVLDAVPKDINPKRVEEILLKNTKIKGVHHLHIWALSSQSNALTAHISLEKPSFGDWEGIKKELKHNLLHEGIQHVTLELEMVDADCKELAC
jgi:cobalt-zinc-cadmium efflux system protein